KRNERERGQESACRQRILELGKGARRERVNDVEQAEQRAVCVRQAPEQAARVVGDVEIQAGLEGVQALEQQAERRKAEQRPETGAQVERRASRVGHSAIVTGRLSRRVARRVKSSAESGAGASCCGSR